MGGSDEIITTLRSSAIIESGEEESVMAQTKNNLPMSRLRSDYGEQDENGVDLSLIRRNLRLSPTERIRRAEKESKGLLGLQEYVREKRS